MSAHSSLEHRLNYGWVIVAALLCITALTIPMAWFGWAPSTRQLAFAFAAPLLGRWIDQHGGGDLFTGVVLAKWFKKNRGRAMSVAFIGMPLGIFIGSPLSEYLIEQYGGRSTWQIFAVVCSSLFVAFVLLLRNPPDSVDTPKTEAGPAPSAPLLAKRLRGNHDFRTGCSQRGDHSERHLAGLFQCPEYRCYPRCRDAHHLGFAILLMLNTPRIEGPDPGAGE